MDKIPKRRKYKDNPYEINKDSDSNKYFVKFRDSRNDIQIIEINAKVYHIFDDSELKDISQMNEYDNHMEHSQMYEYKIDLISSRQNKSLEEEIEDKILFDKLRSSINDLPEIQRRRIKMYFFDNMKLREIAELEGCSIMSIKNSIDVGISKLREKLKKFQN